MRYGFVKGGFVLRNKITKYILSTVLLAILILNIISCEKTPETIFLQTDTYYSYTNVSYGDHDRHYLDLVIPKNASVHSGVILYIHGGGWIAGDKEVYLETLKSNSEKGFISAAINYRYADGKKVTCEDILDDIDAALIKIKSLCQEKGVLVNKVMLTGGSAGGHLSLMYAYTRADTASITPVAVVSCAGPTDLCDSNFYITQYEEDIRKMISKISGGDILNHDLIDSKSKLDAASPINFVDENTVPTILCHGTIDDVVPYSNATTLYDLLVKFNVECELITFDNSGHGLESDYDATKYADQRFYEFAEKHLK